MCTHTAIIDTTIARAAFAAHVTSRTDVYTSATGTA
jgi:hypothetical protein